MNHTFVSMFYYQGPFHTWVKGKEECLPILSIYQRHETRLKRKMLRIEGVTMKSLSKAPLLAQQHTHLGC